MKPIGLHRQKGVTLIVGLIMLILITLMVTTAFTLSTTNLKAVGNMQFRNESIAAANKAIEQYVGTYFDVNFSPPPSTTITFDVNNDGVTDYSVAVAQPVCIQSTQVAGAVLPGQGSSVTTPEFDNTPYYSTLWDIDAAVTDAVSGTSVRVRQGVRVERNAACSP